MDIQLRDSVKKEAQRIIEDTLFSARRHFETARIWSMMHYWLGLPTAVLAAIAGASAFKDNSILAGSLAIIVTALTALMTFLNPNKRANEHHIAGNKYNALRNQTRIFCEIDLSTRDENTDISKKIKELAKERDNLNQASPQTFKWAYKRAKAGIEAGEADYAADQCEPDK
jgi:SMODS and SLOG-associating 2TM effector domain family 4